MAYHGLLLAIACYYLATLYFIAGESCQYSSDPCVCKTTNVEYNLRSLMDSRGGDDFSVLDTDDYTYYIQPCNKRLSKQHALCAYDLVSCQVSSNEQYSYGLGVIDKYTAVGTSESFYLENSYVDSDGVSRMLHLDIKCSNHESISFSGHSGTPPATIVYSFTLLTQHVCTGGITIEVAVSAGTVMVIIFFVLVILYLVVGALFQKFARKAHGKEIIPNYEFWRDFPSLMKEGVLFTFRCCRGNSAYQKI